MYSKIYRNILFPGYESILKKRNTLKYLDMLEKNQWLSHSKLQEIQWGKLKRLLEHIYENVPYYKKIFDEKKMKPDDIKIPEDFRNLPFMTKKDIQDNQEALFAKDYIDKNICTNETGGSTGEPIKFFYPRESYEWRIAATVRSNRWAGWDFGEKLTLIWGTSVVPKSFVKKTKVFLHNYFQRRQFINAFHISEQNLENLVDDIRAFNPVIVEAYVSTIYKIARFIKDNNIKSFEPKAIIVSAETLYDYQRQLMEEVFNCRVFNRYGCSEAMLIAAECGCHNGLHLNMDNLYIEVLRGNKPVPPGEIGEIVLTDLNNYGMPFIRYKVGDIGILSHRTCACGRGLPLLERIEGRTMDILFTMEGRFIQPQIFCFLFREFDWIKQYQIVQEKRGDLLFKVIKRRGFSDAEKDYFFKRVSEVINDSVNVRLETVTDIPLTRSGKFRTVISKVSTDFGNTSI